MRRQRKQYHVIQTGRDRWLVSYADFITLLFGFFVVMYSVSQVNEEKYQQLSTTLAEAFESLDGEGLNADTPEQTFDPALSDSTTADESAEQRFADVLERVNAQLIEAAASSELADSNPVSTQGDWVEISLDASLLFTSGSAALQAGASQVFSDVLPILQAVEDGIEVSGHTDDRPINSLQFPSNWELSSARAAAVVQELTNLGIEPARLKAVGYGQYRPVAENTTDEGRAKNRRVVLKVSRTVKSESFLDAPNEAQNTLAEPQLNPVEEAPEKLLLSPTVISPVKLDSGGLLFTTDPKPERKNR